MNYNILQKSPLFCGLSDDETAFSLRYFSARERSYKKGEYLHRAGERLNVFGFVISGIIHVYSDDYSGHQMMMAIVSPGDSFGESLCFLGVKESPVYIVAAEDAEVLWLSTEKLREISSSPEERDMALRFMSLLATRALRMNDRIQTLSKHSLREKLITFFTPYIRQNGTNSFSLPFDRKNMAIYLGADRSALSRELAKMQSEGIIEYHKNTFRFNGAV